MTRTTNPRTEPRAAALDDWARKQLRVSGGAKGDALRRAFAKQVSRANFQPSRALLEAWMVLRDTPLPHLLVPGSEAEIALNESELAQVAKFAAEFFDLDPSTRRLRWTALQRQIQFPKARAWLVRLASGLSVSLPENAAPGDRVTRLAHDICHTFVMPLSDCAAARRQLLLDRDGEIELWRTAARRLRREHGTVEKLAPDWISEYRWRGRRAIAFPWRSRQEPYQLATPVPRRTVKRRLASTWWIWIVVAVGAGNFERAVRSLWPQAPPFGAPSAFSSPRPTPAVRPPPSATTVAPSADTIVGQGNHFVVAKRHGRYVIKPFLPRSPMMDLTGDFVFEIVLGTDSYRVVPHSRKFFEQDTERRRDDQELWRQVRETGDRLDDFLKNDDARESLEKWCMQTRVRLIDRKMKTGKAAAPEPHEVHESE